MSEKNMSRELPKMPRVVFLPDEKVMRTMIMANLKYAMNESIDVFLLRFGVVENERWHITQFMENK